MAQKQYIELVDSLAGADTTQSSVVETGEGQRFETLAVTCSNGVYSITLNRPNKKNAINVQVSIHVDGDGF